MGLSSRVPTHRSHHSLILIIIRDTVELYNLFEFTSIYFYCTLSLFVFHHREVQYISAGGSKYSYKLLNIKLNVLLKVNLPSQSRIHIELSRKIASVDSFSIKIMQTELILRLIFFSFTYENGLKLYLSTNID